MHHALLHFQTASVMVHESFNIVWGYIILVIYCLVVPCNFHGLAPEVLPIAFSFTFQSLFLYAMSILCDNLIVFVKS